MKTRGIRVKPQISQITQIEEGLRDHVLNSPVAKIHRDVTKVKEPASSPLIGVICEICGL
jgi:hypothetical protein